MIARWIAIAGLTLLAACRPAGPTVDVRTGAGVVTFTVEVVATEPARARGLMYRTELAAHHGMLFVFDEETEHSFWMKNTLIPLDMLFIAGDGRIAGIHARATPLSEAPISVGAPSRYVLEIAGGEAERLGIRTGDHTTFHGVPAPH